MEDTYELLTERREGGRERGEREEDRERGRKKKKEIKRDKRDILYDQLQEKRGNIRKSAQISLQY